MFIKIVIDQRSFFESHEVFIYNFDAQYLFDSFGIFRITIKIDYKKIEAKLSMTLFNVSFLVDANYSRNIHYFNNPQPLNFIYLLFLSLFQEFQCIVQNYSILMMNFKLLL